MATQLLLILSVLYTCIAFAQQWYSSPVPHGRDINCIKIFNRDTIITAGGWHIVSQFQTEISPAYFKTNLSGLGLWNVGNTVDPNLNWIRSIDFTDKNNGISVGWGGNINTTTDGGVNWVAASSPISRDFNKIFLVNAQLMFIAGGTHSDSIAGGMQTILKTINGGQNWNVVLDQPGKWLQSVYFINGTNGYAVGDSGTILKTVNGGNTWSPVTSPILRDFIAIWFTDASTGFIAGGQPSNDSIRTILQTTNGGSTWTVIKDELGGMLRDIHFVNTSTGYAVGDSATVLKTTDGGMNWIPQVIPGTLGDEQFNAVRFYDTDFGFVAGKWGKQYIYNTALPPEVQTAGVDMDSTQAVFKGLVNSHGVSCVYTFRFSPDNFSSIIYDMVYPADIRSTSLAPASYTVLLAGLTPNTSYDYMIKAWTLGGVEYGDTLSFYVGKAGGVKTLGATGITETSATLNGSLSGFAIPMDLYFEYGISPQLGSQIAATPAMVNDTALHTVSANISLLQPNAVYYYRLKGVAGSSNYYGSILTFYPGNPFINLETLPPTSILDSSAILNGQVEGFEIPATISFDYSASNMTFDNTVPADQSQLNDSMHHFVNAGITGLIPATLYHYRLKAETAIGTFYGDTISFYSRLTADNFIQTKPATKVNLSSAELNGEIGGFDIPVDLSFEYGATAAFGSEITGTPNSINDTSTHAVTAILGGLQSNITYYYRLKAEIASGAVFYGEIRQFYTGYSEIPNWDFQYWKRDTVQLANAWNMLGDDFERVPGHTDNYALKVFGTTIAMQGIFYDDGQGGDFSFIKGVPFNFRPDSISVYLNYLVKPGDSAIIIAHLYDTAFNDISTTFFLLGGNSGGTFTRVVFPINYNSGLMPDSLMVGFLPTAPEGNNISNGNYLVIDDIAGVPASPVIYNGDFENWFEYSSNFLLSWFYIKYALIDPQNLIENQFVVQSFFNPPGDYAAELNNAEFESGSWTGGEISNRSGITDKAYGGFPVSERHQSLNGYFKWLPVNGDSLSISVEMRSEGRLIGEGQFLYGPEVTEFKQFDIPIIYTASNIIPDTASITIRSYYTSPPKGASRLVVDKLSFDGFGGVVGMNILDENDSPGVALFPNPSSSIITIQLEKEMEGVLEIFSLRGTLMHTAHFTGNKLDVNTTGFPRGLYLARITVGAKRMANRFIVIR